MTIQCGQRFRQKKRKRMRIRAGTIRNRRRRRPEQSRHTHTERKRRSEKSRGRSEKKQRRSDQREGGQYSALFYFLCSALLLLVRCVFLCSIIISLLLFSWPSLSLSLCLSFFLRFQFQFFGGEGIKPHQQSCFTTYKVQNQGVCSPISIYMQISCINPTSPLSPFIDTTHTYRYIYVHT